MYNPATGAVSAQVRLAGAADLDAAVATASAAWPAWRDASIAKRQTVLFAFRELLTPVAAVGAALLLAAVVLTTIGSPAAHPRDTMEPELHP